MGGGGLKSQILEAKYEAKLKFLGERGSAKQKNLTEGSSMGRTLMDVFWNYTFIELSFNYQFPPPLFAAKLLLTPMKHMVVPPPMSAHAIELPSPASIVSFGPSHLCNDMAVLLSNGCVAIYKSLMENGVKEEFKPPGKVPTHVATYRCYSNSISYKFF